jgi:TRAP-type mannitol/chloroaromatic compound transport system permease small subunit
MVYRLARRITAIIGRLSSYFLLLSGFLIVIMVLAATYGVVRRYVFDSPEPYSYELSMMFLLFSFVFAISAVERLSQQLRVDIVSNKMPDKMRHVVLSIITPILGLAFVCVLFYKGIEAALYSFEIGERSISAWRQPMGPIKLMIPIGYSVLLMVLIVKLVAGVARFRRMLRGKDTQGDYVFSGDEREGE